MVIKIKPSPMKMALMKHYNNENVPALTHLLAPKTRKLL